MMWDFAKGPLLRAAAVVPGRPRGFSGGAAVLASVLLIFPVMPSRGGAVEDWNAEMVRVFQAEGTAPCLGSRHLAILHIAVHNALNSWSPRYPLYAEPDRPAPPAPDPEAKKSDQRPPELADLVAASAAHSVLKALAPGRVAEFDRLLDRSMAATGAGASRDEALATGRARAAEILTARAEDGSSTTVHYFPKTELGQWRRTGPSFRPPEGPHWGLVRPFCLRTPSQFRAPAPPAPDSAALLEAVEECRRLGGRDSTERTAEQTLIARFWSDFSYTSTPPGHWNEILRDISLREKLDTHSAARAFYLLNIAMADAGIAVWDSKYFYNTWRPITAVRHYGGAEWTPLLVTPPHPDYLSGHSGFSGAAADVLESLFPKRGPEWSFTVRSDTLPNETRTFSSFTECAQECSLSRVYGGIHFRHACMEGLNQGGKIGREVMAKHGAPGV